MFTISKVLVAALAFGAVQALPQPQAQPSSTPAPAPAADNAALFRDLLTAPTAIKRFQRLLTSGGEALLTGDALKKLTVFSFNNATPAPNAKGGAAKAAVSQIILVYLESSLTSSQEHRNLPHPHWPRHLHDPWLPRALRYQHSSRSSSCYRVLDSG